MVLAEVHGRRRGKPCLTGALRSLPVHDPSMSCPPRPIGSTGQLLHHCINVATIAYK
jgi:hypothetical protein